MSIYSDRFEPFGVGQLAPRDGLKDARLRRRVEGYQSSVARRYRAINPDRIREELSIHEPLFISPKIDGELWFLRKHAGQVALCAADGRVLQGIPATDDAEAKLLGVNDLLIPGELYVEPQGGYKRPRIHDLQDALKDHEHGAKQLRFAAFDLLEVQGEDAFTQDYEARLARLHDLLGADGLCHAIESIHGNAEATVGAWQEWVDNGVAEGLVVRDARGVTSKIRPSITIDAVILAYGERRRGDIVQVRELIVGLARDDGTYQVLGRITRGMSDLERLHWVERLSKLEVPSSFRLASDEGTLCRFVRPEIVIEINCVELSAVERNGRPVERMVLDYSDGIPNEEDRGGPLSLFRPLLAYISEAVGVDLTDDEEAPTEPLRYDALGLMPMIRPMHSAYVRERPDKRPSVADTGLNQLYRHRPFTGRDDKPNSRRLPPSSLLERAVFTKGNGDDTKVRKYVAFATHKSALDPRYPPYVVHFTDFSPSRGQALKTSVKVASSREKLNQHIQNWRASNIKRGWEEAAG